MSVAGVLSPRPVRSAGRLLSLPVTIALGIFIVTVVRTAWLSDDAYITLRTIDNFVRGHGLRWNIAERVQSYTHPLWLMLVIPFYALTREPLLTTILVSIGVSVAAGYALTRAAAGPPAIVCALTILVSSKGFIDFSTGGLENPLTHLLIVLFAIEYWRDRRDEPGAIRIWGLAGLLILNRMDTVLLMAPALATRVEDLRRRRRAVLIGLVPIVAWELFAFIYYGSPVPNTAYAKLSTGIPQRDLARQGVVYLVDSVSHDPILLLTIGASLVLTYRLAAARADWALPAGVVLYLMYVVWVGGDFMSGRLLTPALVAAVLQIVHVGRDVKTTDWIAATVIVFAFGLTGSGPPLLARHDPGPGEGGIEHSGITDERLWYYPYTGLLLETRKGGRQLPGLGRSALEDKEAGVRAIVKPAVGIYGYLAGPGIHIIDPLGLTDPLLSRLPAEHAWRIGHFSRPVPEGYLESVETNSNRLRDPALATYYDVIRRVTREPVWNLGRLKTAAALSLGRYNKYLSGVPSPWAKSR